eukprot:c4899_g1_i2.p1 GENE.c4899_g1_i2~~c4899_g1_i2.p1  ORF type:complete len:315 (+),score=55.77 c4899_g1_i2:465-1409(+)
MWYILAGPGPQPLGPTYSPGLHVLLGYFCTMSLTVVLFLAFVNFSGTEFVNSPTDPNGIFRGRIWQADMVWAVVWFQALGYGYGGMQGWPFILLPQPWRAISLTLTCIGLAAISRFVAHSLLSDITTSAFGTTLISIRLYHGLAFDGVPFDRWKQPYRGLASLVLSQLILSPAWFFLCRDALLVQLHPRLVALGEPYTEWFDPATLVAWYSLNLITPMLQAHTFYFLRLPMPPFKPLGPFEVSRKTEASSVHPSHVAAPQIQVVPTLDVEPQPQQEQEQQQADLNEQRHRQEQEHLHHRPDGPVVLFLDSEIAV